MTTWSSAHDSAKMMQVAIRGFETIELIIKSAKKTGSDPRPAILLLLKSIKEGYAGLTSPELILLELASFEQTAQTKFDVSDV
jgi:hypothetical protein